MASFEPTIDYCVVKIPRWTFEKFPGTEDFSDHQHEIRGRNHGHRQGRFNEALQKGLRSLEISRYGLYGDGRNPLDSDESLVEDSLIRGPFAHAQQPAHFLSGRRVSGRV